MKIMIEPSDEIYTANINGADVPTRVWRGITLGGVAITAYILSIVPNDAEHDLERFKAELPPFMKPSREVFDVKP